MPSSEWNAWLAPDVEWQVAYAKVEMEVINFLRQASVPDLKGGDTRFSTADLVERLYPEAYARGPGILARKRIFSALEALSKHGLKDYWEPGTPRPLKHNKAKLVTPKVWRAPPPKVPMHVDRYWSLDTGMELDPAGEWVLYEDIKHLL